MLKMGSLVVFVMLSIMFIASALPALMFGQLSVLHLGIGLAALVPLTMASAIKTVEMDDEFLYVTQFRKTVAVPLGLVESASEFGFGRPSLITVRFFEPSPVGSKLTFVPSILPLGFAWDEPHSIIFELQNIASHNQAVSSK